MAHRWPDSKVVPIQFRLTERQMAMLKEVAEKHGTRPNDMARLLMLSLLMRYKTQEVKDETQPASDVSSDGS